MAKDSEYSIAILAGGQSRRFGGDKTLQTINGRSMTSILVQNIGGLSEDIMVICKNPTKFRDVENVRFLSDAYKTQCPLVGIITAIMHAKHDKIFVVSADTPFVQSELVEYMSGKNGDVVLPKTNNKVHTLTGFYSKNLFHAMYQNYLKGNYRIIDILEESLITYVDEKECREHDKNLLSFININTKEDYSDAMEFLKKIGYAL